MMQNHTSNVNMQDPELQALQALRINMQDKICKLIESKWVEMNHSDLSSEWKQRLPGIAKRLEESILKKSLNKDDYMSKFQSGIESWIKNMMIQMEQNQQHQEQQNHQQTTAHNNIQSNSSSVSGVTMIPTPGTSGSAGLSHGIRLFGQNIEPLMNGAGMSDGSGLRLFGRNIQPQMNRAGISDGSRLLPQKQQQQQYNTLSGQVGPGMQSVPMNQKHSSQGFGDGMNNNNGIRLFGRNIEQLMNRAGMPDGSGMRLFGRNIQPQMNRAGISDGSRLQPQKQQQQQYNTLSGQVGPGMQSVPMNQKHSSQGFGDGMNNNNGIRLFGRNIEQLMNGPGPGMSEGHMGIGGTYGNSTKPLQQGFSSQQIQQRMPIMSNMSSTSNLNKISAAAASLHSKPNPSMLTSNHQAGIQQIQQTVQQPIVRSEPFSHQSEGVRAPGPTVTTMVVPDEGSSNLSQREAGYQSQLKLLLLLLHAKYCTSPDGHCPNQNCVKAKPLLEHIETCYLKQCRFYLCKSARKIFHHFLNCQQVKCRGCMQARKFIITAKQTSLTLKSDDPSKGLNGKEVDNKVETEAPVALPASASLALKHSRKGMNLLDSLPGVFSDNMDVEPLPKRRRMDMDIDIASAGTSLLVENEERNDENATEAQEEMEEDGAKKSGPKIKAVSMIQLFTPEQVREHIKSLGLWVGQSKSEAVPMNDSCQLCGVEKLTFKPLPIYCTPCGACIKRNTAYYKPVGTDQQMLYFCIPCFNDASSETMEIEGHVFPKRRLEKKRNDEKTTEEEWVQCDKCDAWQHQICALFNGCMNDGGQAEYTCPNCYIEEVETGERKPLPQSAMLGAKDLPRTILSDHIENRLFKRLKQERQDRANHFGKSIDEVPGAEELVVRVVSSVDKKLEVKPRFLEIFQEENYPTEFPYKSKAILLFQKIEGVEVCLLAMYVQEFGTECASPNQRRVYLSYLDSVKYFTPEIRTVSGEALRTFVYHEILLGYLEFCQSHGFTSCYIWACPPVEGDDYILYCHPKNQKTPKSGILRDWYLSMLKKGVKENIVVELTNLYDHFFTNKGESRAKVTAARLPYFDGDYWPGAAEDMITQLHQEKNDNKLQKEKARNGLITNSPLNLKASEHANSSSHVSKDTMLMNMLGKILQPKREDLILVHLQHPCNHCCTLMVSGTRWVCNSCQYFNLCESCHKEEELRGFRERHPTLNREKHTFRPMEITGTPNDTKDKDDILESEFFDTRRAFLSICQGKHYQYDTLRRAKHSSMMVLYHLHCNDLAMGKR